MSIKFNINIQAAPETIYKAITTNEGYHGWWTKTCAIDCEPGTRSYVRFEKAVVTEEMVFGTLLAERNKKLIWHCLKNNVFPSWVGTAITFDIIPKGIDSVLNFLQESKDTDWINHADYLSSKGGWDFFLNSLKDYCETGEGQPWEQD